MLVVSLVVSNVVVNGGLRYCVLCVVVFVIFLRLWQPALTIGNVGQLAIDALIVTMEVPLVGYLEDEEVLPVVGNDAFAVSGNGVLSTALEVYYRPGDANRKEPAVTLLQQRAPVVHARRNGAFVERLKKEFIDTFKFGKVVLLMSADASRRIDSQLIGTQVRKWESQQSATTGSDRRTSAEVCSAEAASASSQSSQKQPQSSSTTPSEAIPTLEAESFSTCIKHGTVASHMYLLFNNSKSSQSSQSSTSQPTPIPLTLLIHFVHQGYNFPEGLSLASHLVQYLHINAPTLPAAESGSLDSESTPQQQQIAWVLPSSWRHVIRSPAPDPRLFG